MTVLRSRLALLLGMATYLALMLLCLYRMQYMYASILAIAPVGLFVLWLSLLHFERFMFAMAFFVPMSVSVKDVGGGLGLSFPGEVFAAYAALVIGLNFLRNPRIDRRIALHPVSILILVQLVWITATCMTSTYSQVSYKFLVSRLAYLLVYYVGFLMIASDRAKVLRFAWAYMLGFFPVIIYSVIKLSTFGLARSFAPEMCEPFFDDHTVFSACIAMLLPLAFLMGRNPKLLMEELRSKSRIWPMVGMMTMGLALSFSRAAWMSLVAAIGFYWVMRLRIPFWGLVLGLGLVATGVYIQRDSIVEQMAANENDSGDDVLKTAKSITNVSTDESNKERLNRWSSGLEMYKERPWTGFGPGTYESKYGIYQAFHQKTHISTNDGDRGDAHSEYFTALTEQGLPGLFIHLLLLATIFWTGMRVAYKAQEKAIRLVATGVVLGLLTYLIHGAVNSFLDLDKAASLIWGLTGLLVALDIFHSKRDALHLHTVGSSPE